VSGNSSWIPGLRDGTDNMKCQLLSRDQRHCYTWAQPGCAPKNISWLLIHLFIIFSTSAKSVVTYRPKFSIDNTPGKKPPHRNHISAGAPCRQNQEKYLERRAMCVSRMVGL
jgi:hypothetical protein